MSLSYDRRVAGELLVALEPGGFAHSLVEFGGSGMWALDLQLRGLGEERKLYRAALYVGTTKVLDLHLKGHSFALSATATFANPDNGWDPAWERRHDADWFAARWVEVDAYLQVVIEKIMQAGRYVREGMVQAAIGRFPATDFTVIDREAIVSFDSQPEKKACTAELSARWLDALRRVDSPPWWRTRPTSLGDECDVLAVSTTGELLAIEVKPHGLGQGHCVVGAAGGHVRRPLPAMGQPCERQGARGPARYGGTTAPDRPGKRYRNPACRAYQGAPCRRARPESKDQREREAGGGPQVPGLLRSCHRSLPATGQPGRTPGPAVVTVATSPPHSIGSLEPCRNLTEC